MTNICIYCKGLNSCKTVNRQIWPICYPFKESSVGTLLVLRCALCVKSTESPCSGRHPHYPHALPQDARNIAFYWNLFIEVQYIQSNIWIIKWISCLLLWTIDKKKICKLPYMYQSNRIKQNCKTHLDKCLF